MVLFVSVQYGYSMPSVRQPIICVYSFIHRYIDVNYLGGSKFWAILCFSQDVKYKKVVSCTVGPYTINEAIKRSQCRKCCHHQSIQKLYCSLFLFLFKLFFVLSIGWVNEEQNDSRSLTWIIFSWKTVIHRILILRVPSKLSMSSHWQNLSPCAAVSRLQIIYPPPPPVHLYQ